ncbi:MAG: protein kinase [Deltaproteobacteria bacterium]|jgi:serine/threonine protein kinase
MATELAKPGDGITTQTLRNLGCGKTVGRYTVLRRVAAGGMAEVYVAQSRGISGFEKRVAIKKILPQHSHNERFIDMLVDEAKITVSITHPNIAQVYELGLDGEDYFIVMEYVEGRPLNRLMQRVDERGLDTIRVEHAAHVMAEVTQGLDHAHKQTDQKGNPLGIVHRDVSPQNVLIAYEGSVKLIDFGIARAEGRINQTSHGVIKGKLRYLAPEIAQGREPDHRADIFCCGIVLFEMLTGEAMFAPKSDMEAIELATQARVKSPRARNPAVPQELDDIVMRALRKDREDRYQHAKDLYADLRLFLNRHYPSFVASELGDFMKQMFSPEIAEERRLDEAAERLAARLDDSEDEDDPTLAAPSGALAGDLPGDRKGYKQLVTRLGIGEAKPSVKVVGADGGRAMAVVPADPSDRPPINDPSGIEPGGTMPPQLGPGAMSPATPSYIAAAEPTVKADNPFGPGKSILPTVKGPPPEPPQLDETRAANPSSIALRETHDKDARPKVDAQARTASLHVWEENESQVMLAPPAATLLPGEVSKRTQIIRLVVGLFVVLGAGWLAAALFSPDSTEEPERVVIAPNEAPIKVDPVPIGTPEPPKPPPPEPASLRLTVDPQVRIDLEIDGQRLQSNVVTPVEVHDLTPGRVYRIRIGAAGYLSEEVARTFAPGTKTQLEVTLRAARGTIVLSGVEGRVRTSQGEVKGDRIENIRLDSKVEIRVDRPGARAWTKTVHVKDTDPIKLSVPAPRFLPKGRLMINTRPRSTVYIDGKSYGLTPVNARVRAGRHRIVLKSPSGKKQSFSRSVGAGKTTTFTWKWPN